MKHFLFSNQIGRFAVQMSSYYDFIMLLPSTSWKMHLPRSVFSLAFILRLIWPPSDDCKKSCPVTEVASLLILSPDSGSSFPLFAGISIISMISHKSDKQVKIEVLNFKFQYIF